MNLVDAELALQSKIYEAARKLCKEEHLSKAVKKSRLQQCKREENKLKQLQEKAFQVQLEHSRSSPLPAFNITQQGEKWKATRRVQISDPLQEVWIHIMYFLFVFQILEHLMTAHCRILLCKMKVCLTTPHFFQVKKHFLCSRSAWSYEIIVTS